MARGHAHARREPPLHRARLATRLTLECNAPRRRPLASRHREPDRRVHQRPGVERVTVVANDTGGAISQILAAEHPEHLQGLVLTNCDCLENFLPPLLRPLQWLAHVPGAYWLLAQLTRSARLRRSPLGFGMLSHKPIPDQLTDSWMAPLRDSAVRADVTATLRGIDKRDTLAAAKRLSERPLPLLLAWAPEDLVFPIRFAERLAAMIPGTQLEQIAHSRAFVPQDQPKRLAELIAGFVRECSQTQGTAPQTA